MIGAVPHHVAPGQKLWQALVSSSWRESIRRKSWQKQAARRRNSSGISATRAQLDAGALNEPEMPATRYAKSRTRSDCTTRESEKSSRANSKNCRGITYESCYRGVWKDISGGPPRANANGPPDHKESALLMADENPTAHRAIPDPPSNVDGELEDQALVLDRLLAHWPTQLQESDLRRELQLGDDEFSQRDRIDRAVVQLYWAGLALRCGPVVIPTRAALHVYQLIDETSVSL